MKIAGLQKLTLLDFPDTVACLIFTQGCNFRCPYCHNKDLLDSEALNQIEEKDVLTYLIKRKGLLDGVVISGGEPLLQKDIKEFIQKIKSLGYKIKLDTNGSNPDLLIDLINNKLIDYVAMDIKNDFEDYADTIGVKKVNLEKIKQSIEILKNSKIEFEFRTTIVKQKHNLNKLKNICQYIGPSCKYYIQNYRDCNTVLKKGLTGFSEEELDNFKKELNMVFPNVDVR